MGKKCNFKFKLLDKFRIVAFIIIISKYRYSVYIIET